VEGAIAPELKGVGVNAKRSRDFGCAEIRRNLSFNTMHDTPTAVIGLVGAEVSGGVGEQGVQRGGICLGPTAAQLRDYPDAADELEEDVPGIVIDEITAQRSAKGIATGAVITARIDELRGAPRANKGRGLTDAGLTRSIARTREQGHDE